MHNNCLLVHLQFLEGMSQKIMKGIEEAQSDLSKEKQKKDEEVCVPSSDDVTCVTACCPLHAARVLAQYSSGGLPLGLVCPSHPHHTRRKIIQPCTRYNNISSHTLASSLAIT